jgi:sulfur-oxidizing protein SoxZ
MSVGQVRIRVPERAKAGEVITVRVLVTHPMEIMELKGGKPVERRYNFIHRVEATYNGKPVFEAETSQAISQNPLFVFPVRVDAPGIVRVTFHDTEGKTFTAQAEVKF